MSVLEDGFYDLLNEFIRNTPPVLANLNQAISDSDFKVIFSISHGLQGSTGNLGISRLSNLLLELQKMAKSENIEQSVKLGDAVETAFDQAKEALLEKMQP